MLTALLFRRSFSQQNEFLTVAKLHKKKKKKGIIFIDNCANGCYTKIRKNKKEANSMKKSLRLVSLLLAAVLLLPYARF